MSGIVRDFHQPCNIIVEDGLKPQKFPPNLRPEGLSRLSNLSCDDIADPFLAHGPRRKGRTGRGRGNGIRHVN